MTVPVNLWLAQYLSALALAAKHIADQGACYAIVNKNLGPLHTVSSCQLGVLFGVCECGCVCSKVW